MKIQSLWLFLLVLSLAAVLPAGENPSPAPREGRSAEVRHKPGAEAKDKTFFQVLADGGAVMIPLAVCSALTLALITDGLIRIRAAKVAPAASLDRVRRAFRAGDYGGAYRACKGDASVLAGVLRAGLAMLGEGKQSAEAAMAETLARENAALQTRISYLSVIGVVSPMIGLLGTVTGMIKAFGTIGSSGIGDPSALSAAIGEVLVATATGLFVAIPAFAAFYFLRNRVVAATARVEDSVNGLFRRLPWHEVAGMHFGDEPVYAASPRCEDAAVAEALRISSRRISVMLPCPSCNSPLAAGSPACPACNTALEWS